MFPPDTTLDHAAYLLAQAALSVDKVGDSSHFALAWYQAMGALPHDPSAIRQHHNRSSGSSRGQLLAPYHVPSLGGSLPFFRRVQLWLFSPLP